MIDDISEYVPSLINPRLIKKQDRMSLTQNSTVSRFSLSLRKNINNTRLSSNNKEYRKVCSEQKHTQDFVKNNKENIIEPVQVSRSTKNDLNNIFDISFGSDTSIGLIERSNSMKSFSSTTEIIHVTKESLNSGTTVLLETEKPAINVSMCINDSKIVAINSEKTKLKKVVVSHNNNETLIDCEIVENSPLSEYDVDENMNMTLSDQSEKVAVNLEIKKRKLPTDSVVENSKVLILNTNANKKLNHVIIQPPNYKSGKRKIVDKDKLKNCFRRKTFKSDVNDGTYVFDCGIKQIKLNQFLKKVDVLNNNFNRTVTDVLDGNVHRDVEDMSKKSGVTDAIKFDRVQRPYNSVRNNESPRSVRVSARKESTEAVQAGSPNTRNSSANSHSPKKYTDSLHFGLPSRSQSNKTSVCQRIIPHHKIVAGTHFAVDAFSYGEIPNVNHYFLTHFHSDHYSGLKKNFKKMLFCSKITADLCMSRLGVNPKCIHIIKVDETIRVEGVEVTALDANHCPGAIMLVFTLPNGKSLLHTGDFRASPLMESYPIFWNKDIHTIYLDTTYCNPRYDFPTQDDSLEMALFILRQKKLALEKVGKKFSSVLIICGTYTIGKEKLFLGMARRVGCSVWACPEKDRVLHAVEGRSFGLAPPHSCQLHVVPMRDLTHEKLRSYLDSLQGAFSEVVAFKPSGWENGKNSSIEKDSVAIHGIPYSEHSSFSEMIRFVKFLKPKQVIPTVDISGGVKAVQKYFPCPLVYKEDMQCQSKLTDYFSIQSQQQVSAVT